MGSAKKEGARRGSAAAQAGILRLTEALDAVRPLRMRPDALFRAVEAVPFPAALFDRDGAVWAASRVLLRRAKRTAEEADAGKINLLNRVTDENYAVFEAARIVFFGEACAVRGLVRPLSLFARGNGVVAADRYVRAVFCPVAGEDGRVERGVLALFEECQEKGWHL
jgi:hypothetical protein